MCMFIAGGLLVFLQLIALASLEPGQCERVSSEGIYTSETRVTEWNQYLSAQNLLPKIHVCLWAAFEVEYYDA